MLFFLALVMRCLLLFVLMGDVRNRFYWLPHFTSIFFYVFVSVQADISVCVPACDLDDFFTAIAWLALRVTN